MSTPSPHTATVPTPVGPLTIVAAGDTVLAAGWTDDPDALVALIAPALRPDGLRRSPHLGAITDAVAAYVEGDLGAVDRVPVHQRSGPFLEEAWTVLRTVPAGAPVTYAELAAKAGRPDAVRAAASACARNAAALFVPCHRVVRTGGGLGGFRWGLDVKRWLLAHEGAPV
ncbi:MAG: methylated-DNA--[protein]-cysteine S-methyltransferase [Acidimicrobiales bacterium]|nr:methylated-DNA--[protein]-cysteine S-methyltransferase [Acidimicrobiales bacterium]MCB9371662.1 methylated-DNA--[protein]-cysteine S-methyltransferase [Microthrixaceae bacterium]